LATAEYDSSMKKLVRVGLYGGGVIAALAAVLLGGGMWWLKGQFSREAVERQLESMWSADVTLEASELELWGQPARWRLRNLELRALGEGAEKAEPVMRLAEAVLEVSLTDLLRGTLDVKRLNLDGLDVKEYVSPEGMSQMEAVLAKPKVAAQPVAPEPGKTPAKDREEASAVFQADQLGMTVRVREARISGGRLFIHNRVAKTKTLLEDLHFGLTEIDLDPANLAAHNQVSLEMRVKVTVEGRAKVAGEMQDVRFAKLDVSGKGKMQPFDVKTGAWSPVSEWELTLAKGTVLAGYMTIGQASEDMVKKGRDFGLELGDLPMGGELLEPAVLQMAFHENQLLVREDARFVMPMYEARMAKGSWVNSADDKQDLVIRLVCGEELEKRLREGMLKSGLPEQGAEAIVKALQDKVSGRLAIDVRASGKLTSPKVKLAWDRTLEQVLQNSDLQGVLNLLINKK
jgi:hypothetical protein